MRTTIENLKISRSRKWFTVLWLIRQRIVCMRRSRRKMVSRRTDGRIRGDYRRSEYAMKIVQMTLPLVVLFLSATLANAEGEEPLKLEKSIELPGVVSRIDHISI